MKKKLLTPEELIEKSEAFRIFAPYFLEKERTIQQVEKLSGITRQTITDELNRVNMYVDQPRWSKGVKGNPLRLNIALLTDYLSNRLLLKDKESNLLNKIISDPSIKNFVVKNDKSLDIMISKIILVVLSIEMMENIDLSYMARISKRWRSVDISKLNNASYYDKLSLIVNLVFTSSEKAPFGLPKDGETQTIGNTVKSLLDKKPHEFHDLVEKIKESDKISFTMNLYSLFRLISMVFESDIE